MHFFLLFIFVCLFLSRFMYILGIYKGLRPGWVSKLDQGPRGPMDGGWVGKRICSLHNISGWYKGVITYLSAMMIYIDV